MHDAFWAFSYLPWLVYTPDLCFPHSQDTWSVQEETHTVFGQNQGWRWSPVRGPSSWPLYFCPTVVSQGRPGVLRISLPQLSTSLGNAFNRWGFKSYWHLWRKIEKEKKQEVTKSRPGRKVAVCFWDFFFSLFFFIVLLYTCKTSFGWWCCVVSC